VKKGKEFAIIVIKSDTSLHIAQSPTKENHLPNIIKNQVMMKMTRNASTGVIKGPRTSKYKTQVMKKMTTSAMKRK
jgi:hypothetical protein